MENALFFSRMQEIKQCFRRTIWINLAAMCVVIALSVATVGWESAFSLTSLTTAFVYSNSVGTLVGLVITFAVPRFYENSTAARFVKMTVAIFVATLIGVMIGNLLMFASGMSDFYSLNLNTLIFSLVIAFGFGFGFYFYELSQTELAGTKERLRGKELAEAKAQTLASEAQLASLESRIHPHFLFNTLNSIAALIREEPVLAEKMVEKLSALLRHSLDSNAKSVVSLKQELAITEKYLEIEKVRFAERLSYKIEVDEKFSNIKLPPLALQTLVENSIKHVASKTSEKTEIVVSAKENGTGVIIKVSDSGAGFSLDKTPEGHGLDILQRRLAAIFQGEAKLNLVGNGTVQLKLPKNNLVTDLKQNEKIAGLFN